MPKAQQPKISGAICNIPINTDTITNCLPRGIDSSGLIIVKLKKKLSFRGHVLFENVRPDLVKAALHYLKENNMLYSNILINTDIITSELLSLKSTDGIIAHLACRD